MYLGHRLYREYEAPVFNMETGFEVSVKIFAGNWHTKRNVAYCAWAMYVSVSQSGITGGNVAAVVRLCFEMSLCQQQLQPYFHFCSSGFATHANVYRNIEQ